MREGHMLPILPTASDASATVTLRFTMEQRLYTEEGISWSHIEWNLVEAWKYCLGCPLKPSREPAAAFFCAQGKTTERSLTAWKRSRRGLRERSICRSSAASFEADCYTQLLPSAKLLPGLGSSTSSTRSAACQRLQTTPA